MVLNRVGHVLLPLPDLNPVAPSQIIIPEDCFRLLSKSDRVTQVLVKTVEKLFGGNWLDYTNHNICLFLFVRIWSSDILLSHLTSI